MKKTLKFLLLVLFPTLAFAFTDSVTKLSLDLPSGFVLDEEESHIHLDKNNWWYVFSDDENTQIVIEIEEFDRQKSLEEHFHKTLIEKSTDNLDYFMKGFDFRNIEVSGVPMTKCSLSLLDASSGCPHELLYISDYLFVHNRYGFSIGLLKTGMIDTHQLNKMMNQILNSLRFSCE